MGQRLPGTLNDNVASSLARYDSENIGNRIWEKDHTVWKPEPTEISNRLGWLSAPAAMLDEVGHLERVASDADSAGYKDVMLLGMGGSSLAPEVIASCLGSRGSRARLSVLDTTSPAQIRAAENQVDLDHTLFLVSSKSGSTIETLSQYRYFRSRYADSRRFMAITDPGSTLEGIATDERFFRTFLNDPDIGGRYSALSFFGLVPAALTGADIERELREAVAMASACDPSTAAADNPGAWLGIVLAEAALAGRDKLTLVFPDDLRSLGSWIEQLVAESTGKEGTGILPIEGEDPATPDMYGDDRIFVVYGEHPWVDQLEDAGHPVVRYPRFTVGGLGAEFYRWEFATAVACWVLGVNPFDQPNVQEAKDATARALAHTAAPTPTPPAGDVLATLSPGDYLAICAFVPRDAAHAEQLHRAREALRHRYHVPVTIGYGPRYLHSTGQLHKGGPNTGVFLQIVDDDAEDLAIPGADYSFGQLFRAQADGDLASLVARDRRVARLAMRDVAALAEEGHGARA